MADQLDLDPDSGLDPAAVRSVLLAGGGTAGHVNPLLAVADELLARDPDLRVTVLGTAEGLESRLVPERGLTFEVVPKVPLPRRPTADWLHLPRLLRAAVSAAGDAIDQAGAQVVVGFGGYVSTPAYLAARSRGIPVVVHEQNARAGLANRLGARWAAEIAVTFPGTRLPHAHVTGLPLRPEIAGLVAARQDDAAAVRLASAAELALDPDRVTLVVTGGSLGALSLNTAVSAAAQALLATGAQVLHLTGTGKAEAVRAAVRGVPGAERYRVREYLSEMEQALAVADLVVARAGAGTVSELAALGIPAVYVPLPVGNGEQRLNAAPVVAAGGGLLVNDAAFDAGWIEAHLLPLLGDDDSAADERAAMGRAAAGVGVQDAAARVADLVEAQLDAAVQRAAEAQEAREALEARDAQDALEAQQAQDEAGRSTEQVDALALGRVHMIGVGGAGMSAIAGLLAERGLVVSGSDSREGPALGALRAAGVTVHVGHDAAHVDGADTVVVSTAVRPTNPELVRAHELGLPVLHRSEALAALMVGRRAVAVAGAHGKTTTSAMVAAALTAAAEEDPGLDPSYAIGGVVLGGDGVATGYHAGLGDVFVAEADESDGSFLAYEPLVAVVTNVEPDHLDHYGSAERFEAAFAQFAGRLRDGGVLVACADDPGAARLVESVRESLDARGVRVVTYGTADADVVVTQPQDHGQTQTDGSATDGPATDGPAGVTGWPLLLASSVPGLPDAELTLLAPGTHNALNAAAAYVAAWAVGAPGDAAARGLERFAGTGRRFEQRADVDGIRVVDDYAHHPTEVGALLRTARTVAAGGRVLVLFQPHLYSRTRTFATEFAAALDLADQVVVTDVYAAREDLEPEVTGALIVDRVPTPGKAVFVADRHEAARTLAADARPGDLLLTVGAGDVTDLAPEIEAHLRAGGAPSR